MDLKQSTILNATLRAIFPFVIVFSFQIFSYGANFPGGGFQAGVVFGTIVVILEILRDRRIYPNDFYVGIELTGIVLMLIFLIAGAWVAGHPFAGFYDWRGRGLLFSNVYFWLLNFAIYLEVAGSIVLIFRHFIEWSDESEAS